MSVEIKKGVILSMEIIIIATSFDTRLMNVEAQ